MHCAPLAICRRCGPPLLTARCVCCSVCPFYGQYWCLVSPLVGPPRWEVCQRPRRAPQRRRCFIRRGAPLSTDVWPDRHSARRFCHMVGLIDSKPGTLPWHSGMPNNAAVPSETSHGSSILGVPASSFRSPPLVTSPVTSMSTWMLTEHCQPVPV